MLSDDGLRYTVDKTSDRRKRLVVSHFSKNGVLKLEFNEPVEVKSNTLFTNSNKYFKQLVFDFNGSRFRRK